VAGVVSVSWYPPRLADNEGSDVDSVIPLLLDAADKQQLKVYLLITSFCDFLILFQSYDYMTHYFQHSVFFNFVMKCLVEILL